jgi:hypothetical protein
LAPKSSCGYHPQARQDRETKKNTPTSEKPWSRQAPFDFTGCTAHVEIVERTRDGEITRIIGIFEHNMGCRASTLKRLPAIPLHEHVYEVALNSWKMAQSESCIYSERLQALIWAIALLLFKHETDK